ncbi:MULTISPECIES: YceI family protein [Vibrio]|uniref:YceI family protein n=1 Tax=Vibrio algicola TaxID=2662262 RepID=A0A5Q0TJ18_9VIBR|nr:MULTISPECIES: YceI family protein [Vibrio]MBD1576634.1 YceI family protein [Vibrio sp. S11_S32]
MKKWLTTAGLCASMVLPVSAIAADYAIDTKGAHASVNFRVSHLGYSFTQGRFNTFDGTFSYDPSNVTASKVNVVVDTTSVDSNHADRDKHIRSDDFLNASKFSKATFSSTKVTDKGDGKLVIDGTLDLHGKKMPVTIDAQFIGGGEDPWGKERAGFKGTTRLELKDFGIKEMAGATYVDLDLYVEGIKQ